jgi:flagellar motor switch protein FliG
MLSIQLSPEEQVLLDTAAQRTGLQQSELMRQAVREFCQRMLQEQATTPYELGKDLFEIGILAQVPGEPLKRKIWEKLHEKHKRGLG